MTAFQQDFFEKKSYRKKLKYEKKWAQNFYCIFTFYYLVIPDSEIVKKQISEVGCSFVVKSVLKYKKMVKNPFKNVFK